MQFLRRHNHSHSLNRNQCLFHLKPHLCSLRFKKCLDLDNSRGNFTSTAHKGLIFHRIHSLTLHIPTLNCAFHGLWVWFYVFCLHLVFFFIHSHICGVHSKAVISQASEDVGAVKSSAKPKGSLRAECQDQTRRIEQFGHGLLTP